MNLLEIPDRIVYSDPHGEHGPPPPPPNWDATLRRYFIPDAGSSEFPSFYGDGVVQPGDRITGFFEPVPSVSGQPLASLLLLDGSTWPLPVITTVTGVAGQRTPFDFDVSGLTWWTLATVPGTGYSSSPAYIWLDPAEQGGDDGADPRHIVFENIEGGATETEIPDGSLRGSLRVDGSLFGANLATFGGVLAGALRLGMSTIPTEELGEITFGTLGGSLAMAFGYWYGQGIEPPGSVSGAMRFAGGFGSGAFGYAADAVLDPPPLRLYGALVGAAVLPPPPLYVSNVMLSDTFALAFAGSTRVTTTFASLLTLAERTETRWQAHGHMRDAVIFADALTVVHRLLLEASLALGVEGSVSALAMAQLADTLMLSAVVSTYREAHALIAEAIAFGAVADGTELVTFEAGLSLGDTIAAAYTAAARLVDSLSLQADVDADVTLVALLADSLALDETMSVTREAIALLKDGLDFGLLLHLGADDYVAWSMNTTTRGATRYEHYPFNSFMQVGGVYYGATEVGLMRLGGDTDAGEPINAHLRLGMSSLGTRLLKRIPSAYLGYTAAGDLLLKVIVADGSDGKREAHTYRLYPKAAGSYREGRVKIGRGLKSVYFDFQIENVGGADFELDVVEILPQVLERRIRGNEGGKP